MTGAGVVGAVAWALLALACGSSGPPQGVEGRVDLRLKLVESRGDVVSLGAEEGAPTLAVERERGIGGATLELEGGAWPEGLVVALEGFRNLESFMACSGERCVETDLRSAPRARLREGRLEAWSTDVEMPVRACLGSIRVTVPAAAAAGGSGRLVLRWVDEYRD